MHQTLFYMLGVQRGRDGRAAGVRGAFTPGPLWALIGQSLNVCPL